MDDDILKAGDTFTYCNVPLTVTKVSHEDHGFFAQYEELRPFWFSFLEL